jgi:hypothetical protein
MTPSMSNRKEALFGRLVLNRPLHENPTNFEAKVGSNIGL